MTFALNSGSLLGVGNPLLDISANVDDQFLAKYDMAPNNAILASEKQANLVSDLVSTHDVEYIAGGSVQNTLRVVQWFYQTPNLCTFMGAVGSDDFARQMKEKAHEDGVNAVYQVFPDTPTGTCACLINNHGKCRSLCAFLGASQLFTKFHVLKNEEFLTKSQIVYTSGFHIIVSLATSLTLAKHCLENGKLFAFNLSATYISTLFPAELREVLPYVGLLFGNEDEAKAHSDFLHWELSSVEEIAQRLADGPMECASRTVVITQGVNDVIVAVSGGKVPIRRFPVLPLAEKEIVDTNGAGDAFVGGYLAKLLVNAPVEQCVETALYAAREIIKMSGCSLPAVNIYRSDK